MDSVEDSNNEEAYVEDEPQVMNEPNDGPPNGNGGYIQGNFVRTYNQQEDFSSLFYYRLLVISISYLF